MQFCLKRAGRPVLATSVYALLTSLVAVPVVTAAPLQAPASSQAPASGQSSAAGGQQPAKNYKDKGEYDLFAKVTQTQDPKARLAVLQEWQDKYPQTDYIQERNQYWLATYAQAAGSDPALKQKALDKANEILKTDPKNFQAAYLVTLFGPQVGGANPSPDLQTQIDTAAHAVIENAPATFDPAKKPASVTQEAFDKAKNQALGLAHNALAYNAAAKRDNATAESEYKASLQANPDQSVIVAQYAKMLANEKKMPQALFEYARAGEYDGPGALAPAQRQQLLDYFNKAYKDFHGSDDGKQQILDQAKTTAVAPDDLQITDAQALANKDAAALQQRIDSDPGFKIWYAVKQQLQSQGDSYFNGNIKGAEIPGDAVPSKSFTGTVISVDPNRVTLGVEDPAKPDATLEFSQPLSAASLDKIKVGQKLDFSGVADSYTKDPYMLTIKDPTIPGVETAAPARKGTHRR